MKFFNLAEKYVKEAMGYSRQEGRDQYDWWDIDNVANDQSWGESLMTDPSLSDALSDAFNFSRKKTRELKGIYGLNDAEVSEIFKTYIGYHPFYGAYICSIGPYLGTLFVEAKDKFGYYVLRKRKSSENEIMDSVGKHIEKYMNAYGVNLEPGDFKYVVKTVTEGQDPDVVKAKKDIREVVERLDPSDPSFRSFLERSPMIGDGSQFSLNAEGLEKVIQARWGDLYNSVITEVASRDSMSREEVIQRELRNPDFLKSVYAMVNKKYKDAVKSGEAAAMGMTAPPAFSSLERVGLSGAIHFTTIPTNSMQARQLELRNEILGHMNDGVSDVDEITSLLNQHPQRGRVQISREDVQDNVSDIQSLMTSTGSDTETLSASMSGQIEALKTQIGFDDLKTTFDMAKMYFTSLPIDPASKSKLQSKYAPRMAFDPPENFVNVTDGDLLRLRQDASSKREDGEAIDHASEEEIEMEFGGEIEQEKTINEEQTTEPVIEEVLTPKDLDEDEDMPDFSQLLSNTLGNLIKIAAELDDENKTQASEEVHKVIRKYEKRIR